MQSCFRIRNHDPNVTKWDIFHFFVVYAVLHHPEYRERYAANLKRELPRIPFVGAGEEGPGRASLQAGVHAASPTSGAGLQPGGTAGPSARAASPSGAKAPDYRALAVAQDAKEETDDGLGAETKSRVAADAGSAAAPVPLRGTKDDSPTLQRWVGMVEDPESLQGRHKEIFWAFAKAGQRLAEIHVNYEQQPEYPMERTEKGQLNWRVEKMRLSKDKTTLVYNDFLTLRGIPPETYEYRLGNRSALEWVVDQYQVSTDKRSRITNDPNRADDPEYIIRLIGQVISVSLETMKVVKALPPLLVAEAKSMGTNAATSAS